MFFFSYDFSSLIEDGTLDSGGIVEQIKEALPDIQWSLDGIAAVRPPNEDRRYPWHYPTRRDRRSQTDKGIEASL